MRLGVDAVYDGYGVKADLEIVLLDLTGVFVAIVL